MDIEWAGRWTGIAYDIDGSEMWRVEFPNGTTNAGITNNLSVYLGGGTQSTTWYLGLIDNAGFSTLAAADTMASHAGWTEATTYTEATRPTWTPGAAAGQSITNPTEVTFSINGTVTLAGAFIVSNNTKSGTSGTLWAHGQFSSLQSLVNGQSFKLSYTCTGSGS